MVLFKKPVGHKTKQEDNKCEKGTSKEYSGDEKHGRHVREGRGENKLSVLSTRMKLSKNK